MATGLPTGSDRMAAPSWVQLRTRFPAMAMILSLSRIPAALAGDGLSPGRHVPLAEAVALAGRQLLTEPIFVELSLASPIPRASTISRKKARAKCMKDPAASTIARCQPGCRRNDLGSSA